MKHIRPAILIVALLISACGAQPAAPQAALETTEPASAAPTEELFVSASSAPAPSATPPGATATAVPQAEAAPTARLILPPAPTAVEPPPATAPATSPPAAQPAPATQATRAPAQAASRPSQPVRIEINDIEVDGRLVSVGLDSDRIPIVPKHDVGWYNLSAMPGQGENIVLWGHVLRFRDSPKIPAPFARLKELKPGASVVLYDKSGSAHNYVVTKQVWVTPDQVEYILPRGKEMVTMVSCIGDKIIQDGEVIDESHRLITIAEPAA
jgi:LPXTG-site transpeptidase (sortase) family protein